MAVWFMSRPATPARNRPPAFRQQSKFLLGSDGWASIQTPANDIKQFEIMFWSIIGRVTELLNYVRDLLELFR
jgi:hypothetical protein